ncbi:hypothetical protein H0H93_001936 [Arthromyces matolae]|nr:hypothetical protein H0H93_001936 [Arthromyces matolae]
MSSTTSTRESASQSSSVITIASRPRPRPLKKPVKPVTAVLIPPPDNVSGLDDSDISPLTPVSSPVERRTLRDFPRLSPEALPIPVTSTSSTKKPVSSKSTSSRKQPPKSQPHETWDIKKLGKRVWVLVDHLARVHDSTHSETRKDEWIWWPGKVVSTSYTSIPLRISLTNPSGFDVEVVEIRSPSHANILPWNNSNGRRRFEEPEFTSFVVSSSIHASPRKRQKVDKEPLKRRWRLAVEEVEAVDEAKHLPPKKPTIPQKQHATIDRKSPFLLSDDAYDSDLPEIGTEEFRTYSAPSSPVKAVSAKAQSKNKRKMSFSSDSDSEISKTPLAKWSPRPPDISITIPGELVLALERATDTVYWPAKVLEYLPADKPTKQDKYYVEFLDGKLQHIPRRSFYIAEEEKFATCKLGQWDSTVIEVPNDEDDNPAEQQDSDDQRRSTSPIPIQPPPSTDDFRLLSIREQFSYVKPILMAILNENYPPAMQRHSYFIAGGSKRKSAVEEAGLRGQMDPRDVDALQRHVAEWCLRDERKGQVITDEADIPVSLSQESVLEASDTVYARSVSPTATDINSEAELPPNSSFASSASSHDIATNMQRQYGCQAFEALSRSEKNDPATQYCLNVLLPEAILQILLWRTGERTSFEILTDLEEAVLHGKGVELLKASDWVNDVMRLRMAAVGQLGRSRGNGGSKGRARQAGDEVFYSNTGRPQRSAPKSYQE